MAYAMNHFHLKSPDPRGTAEWYVTAFDFTIISDVVRPVGDRFVKCETSTGIVVNISGERTNEDLVQGDANVHYGLEHIGFDVEVDVRSLSGVCYLGHDTAQYEVEWNYLSDSKLWCHAKNIEALEIMLDLGIH